MWEILSEELGAADEQTKEMLSYIESFPVTFVLQLREDSSFVFSFDMSTAKSYLVEGIAKYLQGPYKEATGQEMSDEQATQFAQMLANQMGDDKMEEEGIYTEADGMLSLGDSDPIPYTLTGSTLEFTFENFGNLLFERIG